MCLIFTFFCIQATQVEAWLHPMGVRFWNWKEKVGTAALYDVEYDTQRQAVPFVWCNSKTRQTPLVWYWIWLREANIAIFYDVQYDSKRQTHPSCVKLRLIQGQTLSYCTMTLVMTQRGKLCHLVWCAEYETERQTLSSCVVLNTTECVKRWWAGCPSVVSTNGDIRRKKVGGLLSGFRFRSVGSWSTGWLFFR